MKNLSTKLSALVAVAALTAMQTVFAGGLADSHINSWSGRYSPNHSRFYVNAPDGSATGYLYFAGSAHLDWDKLNLNSNDVLNFNALDGAHNVTVLNTVSGGQMSQIYGTINANGISHVIISNPSGLLFDGAKFTSQGDVTLTTQKMTPIMDGPYMVGYTGVDEVATQGITIQNSDFMVGGQFNLTAPDINVISAALKAANGVKFTTRDGENFLVSTNNGTPNMGVRLESVQIDGDVYITAGKDYTKVVNGSTVDGNMTIDSEGIVALNYTNPENQVFEVKGDLTVNSNGALNPGQTNNYEGHGNFMYLRNAKVEGNLDMANSGGFLEVKDVNVDGNANLTTTTGANPHVKHFVHVIGDSQVGGDLNIESAHNIHIGNYDIQQQALLPGSLKVGGDLNAHAENGHIMVTIDTEADKISLKSDNFNVLSDDKAVLKANEYEFEANGYIGGIGSYVNSQGHTVSAAHNIITVMENYQHLNNPTNAKAYMNVAGGDIVKLKTPSSATAYIKSNGDLTVNNVEAGNVYLTAVSPTNPLGSDIELKDNIVANNVTIGGETKLLTLPLESRNYTLNYTRINGTEPTVIDGATEITYSMLEEEPSGYNVGTQTAENTRIKAPAEPTPPPGPTPPGPTPPGPTPPGPTPPGPTPPEPTPDPVLPPDNDNIKFLNNMNRDQVSTAINAGQVYTPIAFAADLDDEDDTGVRKNVDGSVTVVKPYTPKK